MAACSYYEERNESSACAVLPISMGKNCAKVKRKANNFAIIFISEYTAVVNLQCKHTWSVKLLCSCYKYFSKGCEARRMRMFMKRFVCLRLAVSESFCLTLLAMIHSENYPNFSKTISVQSRKISNHFSEQRNHKTHPQIKILRFRLFTRLVSSKRQPNDLETSSLSEQCSKQSTNIAIFSGGYC